MPPPEETLGNLVQQWLDKAEEDFEVAELLMNENSPYFTAIGFHAQQAVEKYLKAFLVKHHVEFTKTHDLDILLDLILPVNPKLAESLSDITILTGYSVETRYPGDLPEVNKEDAKKAITLARKVREAILDTLKD